MERAGFGTGLNEPFSLFDNRYTRGPTILTRSGAAAFHTRRHPLRKIDELAPRASLLSPWRWSTRAYPAFTHGANQIRSKPRLCSTQAWA